MERRRERERERERGPLDGGTRGDDDATDRDSASAAALAAALAAAEGVAPTTTTPIPCAWPCAGDGPPTAWVLDISADPNPDPDPDAGADADADTDTDAAADADADAGAVVVLYARRPADGGGACGGRRAKMVSRATAADMEETCTTFLRMLPWRTSVTHRDGSALARFWTVRRDVDVRPTRVCKWSCHRRHINAP